MKKISLIFILMAMFFGCGGTNVGHTPAIDIISSSNPASGETNVSVKAAITIYFDAALDETTVTPANIYLTRANGTIYVPGAISYDPAQKSITFTPMFAMVAGANYLLTITSGLLTKANGADFGLSFTTAPSDILIATNENPADPATTVAYNIWKVDPETGAKTPLTSSISPLTFKPLWSPDYTQIVYILGDSLNPQNLIEDGLKANIYVMNADGSAQTNVTNLTGAGQATSPRWSRDGSKIFFQYKADGSRNFDICSRNPDGTGFANLTNTTGGFTTGVPDFGYNFKISPDGLKILYQLQDGATLTTDLHIMNTDGTGDVKLTNMTPSDIAGLGFFSPDGAIIYFWTKSSRDIFSINIDGTSLTNLTNSTSEQWTKLLDVFPDGTKILFKFGEDPTGVEPLYDLYVMNVDGTSKTKLVSAADPNGVTNAMISPDGTKIAYGFGNDTSSINLFTVAADGTDNVGVTDLLPGVAFVDLFWSPNGDKFAYSYAKLTTTGFENGNIDLLNTDRTGFITVTDSAIADAWLGDWW